MTLRAFVSCLGICLLLLAVFGIFSDEVAAQSADQKIATQEGLGNKEFDKSKLPGKLEFGIAIGSVVAAIAAMKYL